MFLIISNNKIIIGACLFKRLNYPISDDQLEGRKDSRQMVIVSLFSEFQNIFLFLLHGYPM